MIKYYIIHNETLISMDFKSCEISSFRASDASSISFLNSSTSGFIIYNIYILR